MRTRSVMLAAITCALAGTLAAAQPPRDAADFARRIPLGTRTILLTQDLAALLDDQQAEAILELLPPEELWASIHQAWKELSARLGWSEREALTRIFGSRAIVVLERADGRVRWGLFASIPVETERRLRDRLDAAPRAIVNGKPVLSIEKGLYLLASSAAREGTTNILIAPAGPGGLFDVLLPCLAADAPALPSPAIDALARLGPWHVASVAKPTQAPAGDYFAAAFRVVPPRVTAAFECRERPVLDARADWPAPSVSRIEQLAGKEGHAVFLDALAARSTGIAGGLSKLFAVAAAPLGPATDRFFVLAPADSRWHTLAIGQRLEGAATSDQIGSLWLAAAEDAPPDTLAGGLGAGAAEAPRATDLAATRAWWSAAFLGPRASAAWQSVAVDGHAWCVTAFAPGRGGAMAGQRLAEATQALTGDGPGGNGEARRWLAEVVIRPREAEARLASRLGFWPPPLRPVERLRAGFWIDGDGLVRGEAEIELAPPRAVPR